MREVVMAGTPEQVLHFREEALTFVDGLTAELGLRGSFVEANDPFFLGDGPADQADIALPDVVKIELRLSLYDDRTLACASFNVHGDFFARHFH